MLNKKIKTKIVKSLLDGSLDEKKLKTQEEIVFALKTENFIKFNEL